MPGKRTIKLWYEDLPGLNTKGKPAILPKPYIDVVINYKHGQMLPTKALVDSGSDTNLFPGVFCRSLGISIKKGIKIPILGIGKRDPITAYRHFGIKMYLEGYSFETFIDFCQEQQTSLLGQDGFFDKFKSVTFKRQEELMIFEEV